MNILGTTAASTIARTVLTMDVSPSMQFPAGKGTRLEAAQQAGSAYVRETASRYPEHEVGIVTFGHAAHVIHPLARASAHRDALETALRSLRTGYSTNIGTGLVKAGCLLGREAGSLNGLWGLFAGLFSMPLQADEKNQRDRKNQSATDRILLLSDGKNMRGENPIAIAERLKGAGAWIETLGFGNSPEEVDEETLKAIASRRPDGSPAYRFVKASGAEVLIKEFKALAHYNLKPM